MINVESDHKPLEAIFKKPLNDAPKRLQRMLMRLQRYRLNVRYKAGKEIYFSDTFSRAYLPYNRRSEVSNIEIVECDQRDTLRICNET